MIKNSLIIFFCLLTVSNFSFANQSQDLLVDSVNQDLNYKDKTLYFSGNVVVTQGNISIKADELFVETNDQGDSEKLIAKGSPAIFAQTGNENETISSQAMTITYLVESRVLTLTGSAEFQQGGAKVSSETIEFDLIAQRVKAKGDKNDNGRVTTRLKTKQN
jgi:lipopolysaccharide export system protein LptA